MTTPTVTEVPGARLAVEPDPFVVGLGESAESMRARRAARARRIAARADRLADRSVGFALEVSEPLGPGARRRVRLYAL